MQYESCSRDGCPYLKHSDKTNNGGTHCCKACKHNLPHGHLCERFTENALVDQEECIKQIEKIIYINLDSRKDRKENLLKYFSMFPSDKFVRFPAIKDSDGRVGCSKSHVGALQVAIKNGWKNVLILEDDAKFSNKGGFTLLKRLMETPFDVILLGGHNGKYDKKTFQVSECLSSQAYIVNKHYYPKLLQNFKDGLNGNIRTRNLDIYALDRYWQRLMKQDKWFCVAPSLVIQDNTLSTITGRNEQYAPNFWI